MEQLHIVDGFGYIFRAYYALMSGSRGVQLATSDGRPTGALYVYARMLGRLHKDVHPERIVVVFDAPGKSFRADLDENYKANRKETPDELVSQLPVFRPLTEAFCWPVVSADGFEADDVIATIVAKAKARDWKVRIFSGDKDLMQLIDDDVGMTDVLRKIDYDAAKVEEKFGVAPEQLGDWLALVGDKSDNIPGMPGVGKVTATKLLKKYGNLQGILDHTDEMKGKQKERFLDETNRRQLKLSRELVTLRTDAPLEIPLDDMVPRPWEPSQLREVFQELEFYALLDSIDEESRQETQESAAEVDISVVLDGKTLEKKAKSLTSDAQVALIPVTVGERWEARQVIGLSFVTSDHDSWYLPLGHRSLDSKQAQLNDLKEPLQELLGRSDITVVCHDGKELRKSLVRIGLELKAPCWDIMLASFLVDANRHASSLHPLLTHLGLPADEFPSDIVAWSPNAAAQTCGAIGARLLEAVPLLTERMEKLGVFHLLEEVEEPLAELLARIEQVGICVDTDALAKLRYELAARIDAIESQVEQIAGERINLGSPKQLGELLFEKLELVAPRMKKKKTGYSTDAEVLESMRGMHDIIEPLLEFRELSKLLGTYVEAIPKLVTDQGRIHTTFAQAVAATGRLSSHDPNLQNIPIRSEVGRQIRQAFVPASGKKLVSLDYSQIELRVMAHLSKDEVLCKAFAEQIDVHSQTASEVFGISLDEVDAGHRRVAKAVNYGLIYGQTDFGLARALDIPRKEAKKYIKTYFERFSGVARYMQEVIEEARATGFTRTMFGRVRPVPEIKANHFQRRKAAERVAQNTPIQGAAADILKKAMLATDELICFEDWDCTMLLTVHDELLFEIAEDHVQEGAAKLQKTMENAVELSVPLVVEVGVGGNWGEAH